MSRKAETLLSLCKGINRHHQRKQTIYIRMCHSTAHLLPWAKYIHCPVLPTDPMGQWATCPPLAKLCPRESPHLCGIYGNHHKNRKPVLNPAYSRNGNFYAMQDWAAEALGAPALGSWRAWETPGHPRSPNLKQTGVGHKIVAQDHTTYVTPTNFGHLCHDKEQGHQFAWPLCHHKRFYRRHKGEVFTP